MEKNTHIKAVIFDLDGTLLNTLYDLTDAVNCALEKYGQPPRSLEEVRAFVGNGLRNLMLQAVPNGDKNPVFEELFVFFREYYKTHCNIKTAPYEDILSLMEELNKRHIKMAIVSNKIDSGVKELNKIHFSEYVEVAIGEREGISRKPAPDSVNEALRMLDVDKENAVYVGDSDVDIQTAENAGVGCISVTWGFRDEDFLKEQGAKILIHRPLELLHYI
ncbi:MAG: HAD family hydrolase [Lachnospiraceae bacterium]|nr:HAD family hydrolase [Lachnospiraceae bacterium]